MLSLSRPTSILEKAPFLNRRAPFLPPSGLFLTLKSSATVFLTSIHPFYSLHFDLHEPWIRSQAGLVRSLRTPTISRTIPTHDWSHVASIAAYDRSVLGLVSRRETRIIIYKNKCLATLRSHVVPSRDPCAFDSYRLRLNNMKKKRVRIMVRC